MVTNHAKSHNNATCVFCKNKKKSTCKVLTNINPERREEILKCANVLGDSEIRNNIETHGDKIKFHYRTCYTNYCRKGNRAIENQNGLSHKESDSGPDQNDESNLSCITPSRRSSKRIKTDEIPKKEEGNPEENKRKPKPCIFCVQMKKKEDTVLYRICEVERAIELIQSTRFNKDDVYTRCVLFQTPGDVFAADVYYHRNCFSAYILKFKRDVEKLLDGEFSADCSTERQVDAIIDQLDMTNNAYSISSVCDDINESLRSDKEGK